MIDMWSSVWGGEVLENRSADREEIHKEQRRNVPTPICGQSHRKR